MYTLMNATYLCMYAEIYICRIETVIVYHTNNALLPERESEGSSSERSRKN